MSKIIYGVISENLGHIDVSNTERGAKNYATRHGYINVSKRDIMRGYVQRVAYKCDKTNKWIAA